MNFHEIVRFKREVLLDQGKLYTLTEYNHGFLIINSEDGRYLLYTDRKTGKPIIGFHLSLVNSVSRWEIKFKISEYEIFDECVKKSVSGIKEEIGEQSVIDKFLSIPEINDSIRKQETGFESRSFQSSPLTEEEKESIGTPTFLEYNSKCEHLFYLDQHQVIITDDIPEHIFYTSFLQQCIALKVNFSYENRPKTLFAHVDNCSDFNFIEHILKVNSKTISAIIYMSTGVNLNTLRDLTDILKKCNISYDLFKSDKTECVLTRDEFLFPNIIKNKPMITTKKEKCLTVLRYPLQPIQGNDDILSKKIFLGELNAIFFELYSKSKSDKELKDRSSLNSLNCIRHLFLKSMTRGRTDKDTEKECASIANKKAKSRYSK